MQKNLDGKNIFENDVENNISDEQNAKVLRQKRVTSAMFVILAILLVLLFIFVFICSPAMINGESMLPTLKEGQIIMVSKIHKTPVLGDIVIYTKPTENKKVIKRVVGVPGDRFIISPNPMGQGFITKEGDTQSYSLTSEQRTFLSTTYRKNVVPGGSNYAGQYYFDVGEDEVFTIGDNEYNSIDGRNYGPIKIKSIIGIKLN